MGLEIVSVAPYFAIMTVLLLLGRGLQASPLALELSSEVRFKSLDGLRGFLALAVFFHHAVARYFYERDGIWEYPKNSSFYTISPQAAVALFFMITGFLFWSKVIKAQGKLSWGRLLISRAKRLIPMYAVSIVMLCVIIGFATHWTLQVPALQLLLQVIHWLSFNFLALPDLNGFKDTWTVQGVIWTLRFEWIFIIGLPVVAVMYKPWRFALIFALGLGGWSITSRDIIMANFLFGMLAAYSRPLLRLSQVLRRPAAAVLGLLALGYVYVGFADTQGLPQIGLLFLFFLVIVSGNDLFGLLSTRGAQYLGAISYSLYLLHGMVLFCAFSLYRRSIGALSDAWHFWGLVAGAGIVTTLLASLTYRLVEERFMHGAEAHTGQSVSPSIAMKSDSPV